MTSPKIAPWARPSMAWLRPTVVERFVAAGIAVRPSNWARLCVGLGAAILISVAVRAQTPGATQCDILAQPPRAVLGRSALAAGVNLGSIDIVPALLACEAAVAAYPGEPRFRTWLGRVLQASRADGEAVAAYRIAAEQGHAFGQTSLGFMLEKGEGVARNDAQAAQWYRRAAEQGDVLAQTRLGILLEEGRGVARNDAQAAQWYRRAAEQGDAQAQNNLGMMLQAGRGVARDDAQAVQWFRRAANQGNAHAQVNLGTMLANGRGVARDRAAAIALYQRAARQGHAEAQETLRRLNLTW
jgi:TPR repeat protein